MPTISLEERVSALEAEVSRHKQELESMPSRLVSAETTLPWWKARIGLFKDDPAYDEAMRYGREYRESLRPKDAEDSEI